jgi:hypothetical protein
MKKLVLLVSVVMLALSLQGWSVQQPVHPDQPGKSTLSEQPAVRTFEGELSKVDSAAKTISLKTAEPGREITFYYDYRTEVVGANGGIQALTGKTGSTVKVSYREERGTYQATKIEIQPQK